MYVFISLSAVQMYDLSFIHLQNATLFIKTSKGIHIVALVTDIADPMRLLKDMRTEGLTLKQNVLGRVFDPGDPNQVRIFSLTTRVSL